ncbi:MAG: alpha/beta hydrolase [Candidatus Thiodiazotropha sp.]
MRKLALMLARYFFTVTGRIAPFIAVRVGEKLFTTPFYSKRRDVEFELLQSADRFQIAMDDGRSMQGYRWGNREDPVVLFVHGWTATATCFMSFIDPLLEQGYQVVSYDVIAHGESPGWSVSVSEWADTVVAAMKELGSVECIVGHSVGAGAVIVASSLGLQTRKVVLVSPLTDILEVVERFAQTLSIPDDVVHRMHQYAWEKYHYSASRYGTDWTDIFNSPFKVPTLLIHDIDDMEITVSHARQLVQRWPWAVLHETRRLGHRRILINPGVISSAMDFIVESGPNSAVATERTLLQAG